MRRTALALALAALAPVLTGCQTTAEKSAKLERAALRKARPATSGATGLPIKRRSSSIHVVDATLVRGSEGTAVAVTLRNSSATAQREVPIALTVHAGGNGVFFTNEEAGLARSLTSVAFVPAHGQTTWVDDQVQGSGTPRNATAEVGDGTPVKAPPPRLVVVAHHVQDEPGAGTTIVGELANRSGSSEREVVLYALARRGGRVVAAGRAVLTNLAAGASAPFQVFLIGRANGATIELGTPVGS